jgi:hypothetical protein
MEEPKRTPKFELVQARELAEALAQHGADYLFLGKAGAILLGYPGTTLDLDLFAPKDAENARRCIAALRDLDFHIDNQTEQALLSGKDFVQIKDGPFDVDIIHAPDGIESFTSAKSRRIMEDIFPIANLRDIIASKKASNRKKDLVDMELLEEFARVHAAAKAQPLPSTLERALERHRDRPASH